MIKYNRELNRKLDSHINGCESLPLKNANARQGLQPSSSVDDLTKMKKISKFDAAHTLHMNRNIEALIKIKEIYKDSPKAKVIESVAKKSILKNPKDKISWITPKSRL